MTKIKFSVLQKNQSAVSIGDTTTIEGRHYPYSSAFFISQNPFNNIAINWRCLSIDFAKWSICRDKAEFIRTNKASRSIAVVEAISHPINRGDTNHLLTKQLRTIKMLFKFILFLGKNRLKIAVRAKSIQQARQQLNLTQHQAVFVARINTKGGLYV